MLADVAEFAGGDLIEVQSSDTLRVAAMLLQQDNRQTLLMANLTSEPQIATMTGIAQAVQLRRLHAQNAVTARREPETFRGQFELNKLSTDRIELSPCEIVRIDW